MFQNPSRPSPSPSHEPCRTSSIYWNRLRFPVCSQEQEFNLVVKATFLEYIPAAWMQVVWKSSNMLNGLLGGNVVAMKHDLSTMHLIKLASFPIRFCRFWCCRSSPSFSETFWNSVPFCPTEVKSRLKRCESDSVLVQPGSLSVDLAATCRNRTPFQQIDDDIWWNIYNIWHNMPCRT